MCQRIKDHKSSTKVKPFRSCTFNFCASIVLLLFFYTLHNVYGRPYFDCPGQKGGALKLVEATALILKAERYDFFFFDKVCCLLFRPTVSHVTQLACSTTSNCVASVYYLQHWFTLVVLICSLNRNSWKMNSCSNYLKVSKKTKQTHNR